MNSALHPLACAPFDSRKVFNVKPIVTQVAIGVSNLSQAIEFYRDKVGFPLLVRDDPHHYARLDGGAINVGLVAGDITPETAPRMAITISTDALHAAYAKLTANGVEFLMPPTKQPWGAMMARFADPDGNWFYLEQANDT